jgi:DNA-binding transcriptional ArsR family regulator
LRSEVQQNTERHWATLLREIVAAPRQALACTGLDPELTIRLTNVMLTVERTFHALSEPTRVAIGEQLGAGSATVGTLAAPHRMSLPAVTKHLGVLESAGLLRRERRGRTVVCTLEPARLREAESWLADRRQFWDATLDRLERLLDSDLDTDA